jgi:hypothetical protein
MYTRACIIRDGLLQRQDVPEWKRTEDHASLSVLEIFYPGKASAHTTPRDKTSEMTRGLNLLPREHYTVLAEVIFHQLF